MCLLTAVETSLIHAPEGYSSPDFAEAVNDYLALGTKDTGSNPGLARTAQSIIERIRIQAYKVYINEASDRYEHEGGKTRSFAVAMGEWIEKGVKRVNKKFPEGVTE